MATAPQSHFVSFVMYISGGKLLQHVQRYSRFSILPFQLHSLLPHHSPNLHNTKTLIALERKKIFQKRKHHSSAFGEAFEIRSTYFSFHGHFKRYESQNNTLSLFGSIPQQGPITRSLQLPHMFEFKLNNCNHKHGLMLTCRHDVDMFT